MNYTAIHTKTSKLSLPKDGLDGFKESFGTDAISGFLVFLLAMPLSLGIAKASDFPPIMGIVTAMIGGIVVSFFAGSQLTIKGPAAGLIVICSGAVAEFGGGENGWHLALGTIFVAGVVQVLFGALKIGKYADFVPRAAIHGMLVAIGLIIFSKQIHTLLGIDPAMLKGLGPLALLARVPQSLMEVNQSIALIGLLGLVIMFGLPMIPIKAIKKIPAPLIVLLVSIPLGLLMDFKNAQPGYALVKVGSLAEKVKLNVDFSGLAQTGVFIKYVILFALIGSIESILTVKAIDGKDPFHRKSNYNKDIIAIGIGNIVSAVLGGLPMISEVARSSANVDNGAKTRWANLFHGLSLLIFVLLATSVIEMIPNAALASMLIFVGYRLASPKEVRHMYNVGWQQLTVFLVTIFITLFEDLLLGVFAGIILELVLNVIQGKTSRVNIFKADVHMATENETKYRLDLAGSATFSNYMSIKKHMDKIPTHHHVTVDLTNVHLADHTVLENLHALARDYEQGGGSMSVIGLDSLKVLGKTHSSPHKKNPAMVVHT